MATFMQPDDNNEEILAKIPSEIPILPLRNTVSYPFSVLPLMVGVPRSVKLIEDALEGDRIIGLLTMKDPSLEEPQQAKFLKLARWQRSTASRRPRMIPCRSLFMVSSVFE